MNWLGINDIIFEKIACAYASDMYKEYTWIPTGKSWDGNKDAAFREKIQSLNYYYKGWCEAKYTQSPESSIPKSHMDSTLVSGILDGEVIFILFVTNGKISSDFIQRATAILEPHRINVKFVDGSILENWIKNRQDIIDKYFQHISLELTDVNLEIEIKDSAFFYAIMSSPSLASPVTKLRVNKEYFLYLNLYSNQQKQFYFELNTNVLKRIPSEDIEYMMSPGYNSFLIKYLAKYPYEGKLEFSLFVDDELALKENLLNLIIEADDVPDIVYSRQQSIQQEIFDCTKETFSQNVILQIYGGEGSGKSFLLQQLIPSIVDKYNQLLTINFSEKEAENASSLCKMILFINFGFLYDLSEDAFKHLIENYSNFSFDIFMELREGTKNQITALNTIKKITFLLERKPCALFPNQNHISHRDTTFIVADDVQKISREQGTIFNKIIEEFIVRCYSQILIICNRPNEFYNPETERIIQNIRSGKWELPGISISDVYSSIKKNFNWDIASLTKLFPVPVSVLHLELLIRKLKDKNILRVPREKRGIIFSNAYEETNIVSNHFAVNKIRNCKYLNLLYIVYKIESGVPVQLLHDFYKEQYVRASKNFKKDTLIKEENSNLRPYHDIYLYAFSQMYFEDSYMDELNYFLQFCVERNIQNPILLSNILSILIEKNNVLRMNYLDSARKVCAEYYSKSEYIAAQNLALMLLPDLDNTPYSEYKYADLELLYIYAQSEKYSKTHIGSSKYLQLIADIGNVISLSPKEKGIVQEVHSELITNYLYSLDFENFKNELSYFDVHLKNKTDIRSSEHKINAYLNFLNRKILYAFFTDADDLENTYIYANEESKRLNREDYQAYSDMDYAKILIYTNAERSIDLFKNALPIFEKYPQCKKREIDCKAEIVFVEHLLYEFDYDQLYLLQKEALDNKFIHVYARITLIILTLELLENELPENIEMKLIKLLIDYPDLNTSNRLSLFVNQLFTAIYYKNGEFEKQSKYAYKQQEMAFKLSSTYLDVPRHNQTKMISHHIVWKRNNVNDVFNSLWLDPRIW